MKLENDETILYEGQVFSKEKNCEYELTLTSKRLILKQEKGLFKKRLKVVDIIPLDTIKIYKNKVQVKQTREDLFIQTFDKNITLKCVNIIEAKKLETKIIDTKTGSNILERNTDKLNKALEIMRKTRDVLSGILIVVGPLVSIINHKKSSKK